MSREVLLEADGRSYRVRLGSGDRVSMDGSEDMIAAPLGRGVWRVTHGDRQHLLFAAVAAGRCFVFADGETWELTPGRPGAPPARPSDSGPLAAPMPATVARIFAEPGRRVSSGETLIMLEAMKMEHPIRTSRDGRVTAVHCREGQLVEAGTVLIEIEP